MPRVPTLSGPSVAPTAAPDVRQQSPTSAAMLDVGNRQVGALGDVIGNAGNELARVQQTLLDQANALRVDDALNQAQESALRLQHGEQGYTTFKGYDALNRASGMPLADEYTSKLDQDLARIGDSLGNEQQRAMFARRAAGLRTNFLGNALQYTGQQSAVYGQSVREASVSNAANALVLNFSDPTNVGVQVARIRASIEGGVDENGVPIPGLAQMQGKSAAWAKEKADEAVSAAHIQAVQAAMEAGNVNGAMAYRKKYADQMTAADMLRVDGVLQKNYDTMQGATIGSQIMGSGVVQSALDPSDYDRLRYIRTQLESGGQGDFGPDGKLLQGPLTKSGERAQGSAQVMPSTAANPGYGIRPADMTGTPAQQAAELRRVGDEKLAVLLKMFDGNVSKAMGAYNWGEGNVKKAEKQAQEAAGKGEAVPPDAWLAYAPKETRNYVEKATSMYGNPVASAPRRPTLQQLQQQAREQLGPNASPLAIKSAMDTISAQYETQTKAIAQRKDETVSAAMQELEQNGGRFSELSPKTRSALTQYAPDKVDEVLSYGQKISKGDDVTDPRLYLRLSNMTPGELKGMSDAQFFALKGGLSQSDFQHFSTVRGQVISGKVGDSSGDINEQAINRTFNQRLQSLGIQVNPDKRNEAEQMRVGAMRSFIDKAVMAAQRQAGKKLNDVEVAKVIDETFAQNTTFRQGFFSFGAAQTGPMLTTTIDTMPTDAKEGIKKAFAAKGISNPTDGQILGVYFEAQANRNKRNATVPGAGPAAPAAPGGGASGSY